jgi:hypothetical protein
MLVILNATWYSWNILLHKNCKVWVEKLRTVTIPTLNKVIIKCTIHYIVHVQFSFSLVRVKLRDSEVVAWVRGQRKMSQVLGAFGLLDFTMLQPILARHKFWNLWTVYLFNFPIFFQAEVNRGFWISGYGGTTVFLYLIWRQPMAGSEIYRLIRHTKIKVGSKRTFIVYFNM